jgi:hypothetical protein
MDEQEVVIVGADGTEHVFPGGFNPQRAAAIVRGESPSSGGAATPAALTALGAMKAAPALASGVNAAAQATGRVMSSPAAGGVLAGLTSGLAAAGQPKAAMLVGAGGAALPRAAGLVEKMGPTLMRGAGWLSRAAGTASTPLTLISMLMDAKAQTDQLAADPTIDGEEKRRIRQRLMRPFEQ